MSWPPLRHLNRVADRDDGPDFQRVTSGVAPEERAGPRFPRHVTSLLREGLAQRVLRSQQFAFHTVVFTALEMVFARRLVAAGDGAPGALLQESKRHPANGIHGPSFFVPRCMCSADNCDGVVDRRGVRLTEVGVLTAACHQETRDTPFGIHC